MFTTYKSSKYFCELGNFLFPVKKSPVLFQVKRVCKGSPVNLLFTISITLKVKSGIMKLSPYSPPPSQLPKIGNGLLCAFFIDIRCIMFLPSQQSGLKLQYVYTYLLQTYTSVCQSITESCLQMISLQNFFLSLFCLGDDHTSEMEIPHSCTETKWSQKCSPRMAFLRQKHKLLLQVKQICINKTCVPRSWCLYVIIILHKRLTLSGLNWLLQGGWFALHIFKRSKMDAIFLFRKKRREWVGHGEQY